MRLAVGDRWRRWVGFVGAQETGEGLALFRMLSGLALIVSIGATAANGLVGAFWVDASFGGIRSLPPTWRYDLLGGATPTAAWTCVLAALGAGVALVVGIGARAAALIGGQALMALAAANPHARASYDGLLINSLWLLVLADSTATLSLRCRLRHGAWTSDALVGAWPRYLTIAQLGVLYLFTGLHKVSIYWTPAGGFSALYYIMQQPSWQLGSMHWLAWIYPVTQISTAVAWIFELSWPLMWLALYFRLHPDRPGRVRRWFNRLRVRTIYAAVGASMHLGIAIAMDVGPFTYVTLAFYPCLFRPQELRAAWTAVSRRLRSRRSPASKATLPV